MKSLLFLILSLTNISFAKSATNSKEEKKSFAEQVMRKSNTSETDSIKSQDCNSGGGGGR